MMFGAGIDEDPFAKVKGWPWTSSRSCRRRPCLRRARRRSLPEKVCVATVRCDSPRSAYMEVPCGHGALWVESGSGSLATPRCAEPREVLGAGCGSARVRSNVFTTQHQKKSRTRTTPAARARLCTCVCVCSSVRARAVHARLMVQAEICTVFRPHSLSHAVPVSVPSSCVSSSVIS